MRRASMTDVAWLGTAEAHDTATVGGKASSLSRLAAEHRVPPGFVLRVAALRHAAPDLTQGTVPEPLRASIAAAYSTLGSGTVAVRSSAIDEDGDAHSFAGQHATYLNVQGLDAIERAVVDCFASAFTDHAIGYRLRVGSPVDEIGIAILVQTQVAADSAAVVFSANPVSQSLDEIVINATYGLGESIVSGTATPDTFVVRKADLEIVSRTIGPKHVMTVPVPGGTREYDTPALLRGRPSVTDDEIVELAALALGLETSSGMPVDIECAVQDGTVFLLQCRPITTLRTRSGAETGAP
jgi:phosphoenolpyruvate synthase/pyruvate phosphate dikinase